MAALSAVIPNTMFDHTQIDPVCCMRPWFSETHSSPPFSWSVAPSARSRSFAFFFFFRSSASLCAEFYTFGFLSARSALSCAPFSSSSSPALVLAASSLRPLSWVIASHFRLARGSCAFALLLARNSSVSASRLFLDFASDAARIEVRAFSRLFASALLSAFSLLAFSANQLLRFAELLHFVYICRWDRPAFFWLQAPQLKVCDI